MIRGENVICGTTTTGTGTLTLKACPVPPGGVDPYAAFTGTGGLGTSQTTPMTYTIIEYVDGTFSTCKQQEKGIGFLLLGANIGASTLARTTPQETATSLNTSTPTYTAGAPTAITIGTAANVLVFIAASATDIPAFLPYFDTTVSGIDNLGVMQWATMNAALFNVQVGNLTDNYNLFTWTCPMLVKRCSMRVQAAYTGSGGTPISAAYARIYAISTGGRPGKLLLDLGAFAGANCLNATGNITTSLLTTGFYLMPGEYFFNFLASFSGATGPSGPNMVSQAAAPMMTSRMGVTGFVINNLSQGSSGTAGAAPDPANTTGYAIFQSNNYCFSFTLNSS